ncbi:MAG TPA: hypothetical protein PLX89_17070 [Verrucomicrobiota bacterium]|nr:hypothetical protein [Verrucomicrobiota bacterium]
MIEQNTLHTGSTTTPAARAAYAFEGIEKFVEADADFQITKESIHGNPGAAEAGLARVVPGPARQDPREA